MRRKLTVAFLVILLLLAAAHSLVWRWSTQSLDTGFNTWAAARRAQGWSILAAQPVVGGWPLAARVTVPALVVKGGDPDIPGGLTWSAERLVLSISLFRPHLLQIASEGAQRLRLSDLPDIPYTADRLHLDVPLAPGIPPRTARLTGINLRAGMPSGPDAVSGLTIARVRLQGELHPAAPAEESALDVSGAASNIALPPDRAWPLGPTVDNLTFTAALSGPLPKIHGLTTRATGWRDGGGTLEVSALNLDWGPATLSATATLALDDKLQPMGTGTAHISGYAEGLDALAANGTINKRAALAAKAVLGLLAKPSDDGALPEVEVPLTLQDRTLSMRQIPLRRVPVLDWPAP